MLDKSKLGSRYACFSCGTKFYDLNRPEPTCPECGADQREAPVQDIKAILASSGRKRARAEPDPEPSLSLDDEDEDDDDDEDAVGLLDDADMDDDEDDDD